MRPTVAVIAKPVPGSASRNRPAGLTGRLAFFREAVWIGRSIRVERLLARLVSASYSDRRAGSGYQSGKDIGARLVHGPVKQFHQGGIIIVTFTCGHKKSMNFRG